MNRRTLFKTVGLGVLGLYLRIAPNTVKALDTMPVERPPEVQFDDAMRGESYGFMRYKGQTISNADAIKLVSRRL